MKLSAKAQEIHNQIAKEGTKLGDIRKLAKTIKKNHDLAMELWSTEEFYSMQLAILIMDKNLLTQEHINALEEAILTQEYKNQNHLTDWLMANQLMKNKKTIALMESWEDSPSAIQRRIFWYYQARLRWTGQTPPPNSLTLLESLETKMENEEPKVQWAMNFLAGQIGVHEVEYRSRCIALGERLSLYKEDRAPKGCTPNYLPGFIEMEAAKWKK